MEFYDISIWNTVNEKYYKLFASRLGFFLLRNGGLFLKGHFRKEEEEDCKTN
jgi:hypothetical protein